MDNSSPDQTIARFKAFWLVIGLVLAVAVLGLIFRYVGRPSGELDTAAGELRSKTLETVRKAQQQAVGELGLVWHDPQGGHLPSVSVPQPIIDKAVAALKQSPARKDEARGPIAGSKTFLEQQSKKHDPTESEFLKK